MLIHLIIGDKFDRLVKVVYTRVSVVKITCFPL